MHRWLRRGPLMRKNASLAKRTRPAESNDSRASGLSAKIVLSCSLASASTASCSCSVADARIDGPTLLEQPRRGLVERDAKFAGLDRAFEAADLLAIDAGQPDGEILRPTNRSNRRAQQPPQQRGAAGRGKQSRDDGPEPDPFTQGTQRLRAAFQPHPPEQRAGDDRVPGDDAIPAAVVI
ncbi:MAG: hypothetical protein V9G29_18500 [Burkholderiaceae bacterium]